MGTVKFMYGSLVLGTEPLIEQSGTFTGIATLSQSTTGIPAGTYAVKAIYNGDKVNKSSTSAAVTVVAQNSPDSAVVRASPNPVPNGESTTLTATVIGSDTPTGTMAFYAGRNCWGQQRCRAEAVRGAYCFRGGRWRREVIK